VLIISVAVFQGRPLSTEVPWGVELRKRELNFSEPKTRAVRGVKGMGGGAVGMGVGPWGQGVTAT
jgi:hypothetical protein